MARKTQEQTYQLKLALRDELARDPMMPMTHLQEALKKRGFITVNGNALDERYLAKVIRKLNREKAIAVDTQKVNERLGEMKERYRLIVQRLWMIICWKTDYIEQGIWPPKAADVTKAIDTLLKLDLAILKAEMDAGIFDRKLGTVDLNIHRAVILAPEDADMIAAAFARWGVRLDLPQPKAAIEAQPTNGTADISVERIQGAP